jgi:hypothetical protein
LAKIGAQIPKFSDKDTSKVSSNTQISGHRFDKFWASNTQIRGHQLGSFPGPNFTEETNCSLGALKTQWEKLPMAGT